MTTNTMKRIDYSYLERLGRDMFLLINDRRLINALTDRLYAGSHFCGCPGKCDCRLKLRKHIQGIYKSNHT